MIRPPWPTAIVPYPLEPDAMSPQAELPRYRAHKVVHALQIKWIEDRLQVTGDVALHFKETGEEGYATVTLPAPVFARYMPRPGDYYVVYDNIDKATGKFYVSISPRAVFEAGYSLIPEGEAS